MATVPTRREPAPFRDASVVAIRDLSPCLRRLTVECDRLGELEPPEPAASVRALLPDASGTVPEVTWNGNEFLLADGSRPTIRTVTPLRFDPGRRRLDLEIVAHDGGPLSEWATAAAVGTPFGLSEFGRGFVPDPEVRSWILAGDEAALPAISSLLEALGDHTTVRVLLERRRPDCELQLATRAGVTVSWCDSFVEGIRGLDLGRDEHLWVAGEAAAVQQVRNHLFRELGLARSVAHVRGYWKRGRATRG